MSEEIKKIQTVTKIINDNKSVALMCPKCFNIVGICHQELKVSFSHKSEPEKFYGHNIQIQVDGWCEECGEYIEEFLTIDGEIAPTISVLNKKGWKTLFCCAGHDGDSSAYIYFKSNKYLKYIAILPKGWKLDVIDYTQRKDFIIRSKHGCYDSFELYEWAQRLPKIPELVKQRLLPDEELMEILLNLPKDQLDFNEEETEE